MLFANNTDNSLWWTLPEPVVLQIMSYLGPKDILNAGQTCRRWYEISHEDFLWRKLFHRDFKIQKNIGIKPGSENWRSEYKRLTFNIPLVLTEVLGGHTNQVLHVSFSNNGEMFATCSKDGNVIIWNSTYPCAIKFSHNMKTFSWKYTQFSQFNRTDSLLLVSGVHFGSPNSTSGEIAVFTVDNKDGSYLRCRVVNRPYDIFGTWFSDQYLISGGLRWLAHLVSTSVLWLNKANQEIDSEHVPIMNQLYKFYNRNASSVRAIMIANCPWLNDTNDPLANDIDMNLPSGSPKNYDQNQQQSNQTGNPISHVKLRTVRHKSPDHNYLLDLPLNKSSNNDYHSNIHYVDEYRREYDGGSCSSSCDDEDIEDQNPTSSANDILYDDDDELENSVPKYLIFSTGAATYTPHQIGIKRIRNVNFPKKLDPGLSLKERIEAKKREKEEQNNHPRVEPDWWNYEAVADKFDPVDKVIDLHGHIIGMALSPDHRYLYVNTRPWPQNYVIDNPLEPPPIAQEIDIHVIDLMTLKHVGNLLKAHKAYTPNTECFFIFLNVCDNYVASGAEDMHAYLWDHYYGMLLSKYKHTDVVNSVAFNPKDSEMLVTTSDDYTIKVWRSRNKVKQLNVENSTVATEFRKKCN